MERLTIAITCSMAAIWLQNRWVLAASDVTTNQKAADEGGNDGGDVCGGCGGGNERVLK